MNPSETKTQEESKETQAPSAFLKNYERTSVLTKLNQTKEYLISQGIQPDWGVFELISIYHCPKQNTIRKSQCFGAKVRVPFEHLSLAEKVDQDLKNNQKDLARAIDLQCNKHPGERFEPFIRASVPGTASEDLTITQEKGKILLMVFWGTWCKPSWSLPENVDTLLENNKSKWKDRVQAVCIAAERSKVNSLATLLKETPFANLTHYETQGRWDHPSIRMYGVRATPHVILCDAEGVIKYSGHPDKVSLESLINEMINGAKIEETTLTRHWSTKETIGSAEFKKIKGLLKGEAGKELYQMNDKKNREGFFGVGLNMKKTKVYDLALEPVVVNRTKLTLNVSVLDIEQENILSFIKKNLGELPPEYYDIQVEPQQSFKFEYGKNCVKCKVELSETKPQYYCPFDQLYYCEECGQFIDSQKKGTEKLVEEHPLLYVNAKRGDDLKRMIQSRVVGQWQMMVWEEEEEGRNHPGIACDSCSGDLENTTRWKCVNCLDLDICGSCFEKLKPGDEDVKTALQKAGHDEESHSYIRFYYRAMKY